MSDRPITMDDKCNPQCPFLKHGKFDSLLATCTRDNKPIDYYDWFIAHCLYSKEDYKEWLKNE